MNADLILQYFERGLLGLGQSGKRANPHEHTLRRHPRRGQEEGPQRLGLDCEPDAFVLPLHSASQYSKTAWTVE